MVLLQEPLREPCNHNTIIGLFRKIFNRNLLLHLNSIPKYTSGATHSACLARGFMIKWRHTRRRHNVIRLDVQQSLESRHALYPFIGEIEKVIPNQEIRCEL